MIEIPIPVRVDLDRGIKKTYLDTIFATEDNKAHRFDVSLHLKKEPLDLPSGATVSAYFIRYSDNGTVMLDGKVSGNIASVTLNKACYNKSGPFALVIKVLSGDEVTTVFYGEGSMFVSRTDTIIDDEHIIPSLDDLLAQIARMEQGTADANTATANANTAADTANASADNANQAAERANAEAEAAEGWAEATATAVTLDAGEDAAVSLTTAENGNKNIEFSIPRGNPGVYIGPDEPTDPTVMVWIDEDGDPDSLPEGITQEDIQEAVDNYLAEHPATGGATAEEAAQIQQNKEDIATLKTGKADKTEIPTVPTALPNPQALTINGTAYDGSKAVNLTIEGGPGGTGAEIDDTTPSSTTTYSSQKIEVEHTQLKEAIDAQGEEIGKKVNNAGWTGGKYLGTDDGGNVVEREAPAGGGSYILTEEDKQEIAALVENNGLPLLYDIELTEDVRWVDTGKDAFVAKNVFYIVAHVKPSDANSSDTAMTGSVYGTGSMVDPIYPWSNYVITNGSESVKAISNSTETYMYSILIRGNDGTWAGLGTIRNKANANMPNLYNRGHGIEKDVGDITGIFIGDGSAAAGTRVLGAGTRIRVWGV